MPQITVGTEIRKVYDGVEHLVVVTNVRTDNGSVVGVRWNGTQYPSLTAVAKAIKRDDRSINGWDFFGLENPVRITRTRSTSKPRPATKCEGKCQREGCYEPADCKHGFCHRHCTHEHRLGAYASRKYPRCDACHIGVEIEVKYNNQHDFRRGLPLEGHYDNSLGSYGAEYKVLGKATQVAAMCGELVKELWKRGARVDRHCGMHVHIDVRQLDGTRRQDMLGWMLRTQETWFSLVPPSRRNNHFVQRMSGTHGNHTTWAHPTVYNTVEVRLHGGTLNPYKIEGWLVALIHLQAKANDATYAFPDTGDSAADFWSLFADCPREGKEYLKARADNDGVVQDRAFRHIEE